VAVVVAAGVVVEEAEGVAGGVGEVEVEVAGAVSVGSTSASCSTLGASDTDQGNVALLASALAVD
jgi:hypothetical protein